MPKNDLTTIQFHDATLLVRRGDTPETTLVAMKPVVEGMGLDWGGQHKKLSNHPVLAQGISVMEIPSAGGFQEATALPLNRIHFWLATTPSSQKVFRNSKCLRLAVRRGDTPETTLVAMKPVVEGMGLDWGGLHPSIQFGRHADAI